MQARGWKGTSQVNLEIALLQAATKWAVEYVDYLGVVDSPFKIKKYKVDAADRYVTDEEYSIQLEQAAHIAAYLPAVFEITYLTAARGGDA